MKEPKWKIFHGAECPNCGDAVEVYSKSPIENDTEDITWVFDEEDVRCASGCGFLSSTIVDEEIANISDGNLDELLNSED